MSRHSPKEMERIKRIAAKMTVETGEAKAHSLHRLVGQSGPEIQNPKYKIGDRLKLDNHNGTWVQIISAPDAVHQKYTVLTESGYVSYYSESALMTKDEWLKWWERFRDEMIPREWRECAENARRDFVPPPKWDEWVKRASEP